MTLFKINRRIFIKQTGLTVAGLALVSKSTDDFKKISTMKNKLPRWKGFNLQDFYTPVPGPNSANKMTSEDELRWIADWGFDFIRLPLAYPRYIDFDISKGMTPGDVYKINEKVVNEIDNFIFTAHKCGLHVSLNLHRAPGYCVNSGFKEPFDLWKDKAAQDAFYFHWGMWAKRYKNVSPKKISFDLLNEPCIREDLNDQHSAKISVPGKLYRMLIMNAAKVIRDANPDRIIIADGNDIGNSIIPEIEDLDIAQGCRGYTPHFVSHYKAPWAYKDPDLLPTPTWPGKENGQYFGNEQLEAYYKPWIELVNKGIGVHCGECGCWNKTPHDVFLAWFEDVLDILTKNKIGYALWNFKGDFGILDSGRKDVDYEIWRGHNLDSKLLNLLKKH